MEAQRDVVRLSLGGGQPVLNVLAAGVEGDRLSLVCPFPILPLGMPVSVTLPGEGGGFVAGVLRTVKVDMSGETGLPRFRLQLDLEPREQLQLDFDAPGSHGLGAGEGVSIELDEFGAEPSGFDAEAAEDLAAEARAGARDGRLADPEDVAAVLEAARDPGPAADDAPFVLGLADGADDAPFVLGPADEVEASPVVEPTSAEDEIDEFNWPLSDELREAGELEDAELATGPSEGGLESLPPELDDDPPWAASGFDATPTEQMDELRSRAGWPVRTAVTLALLISVAAVGYVLRQQVQAAVAPWLGETVSLAGLSLDLAPAPAEVALAPTEAPAQAAPARPAPEAEPPAGDDLAAVQPVAFEEPPPLAEPEPEPRAEPAEGADQDAPPPAGQPDELLRLMLPTQWPVSEARSYRLNDPTGIVVDVPGGMASEAARFVDTSNGRIRSVRVIERQGGVRFIIYLTDDVVPRYRVGYGRNGVTVDILGPDPRHRTT